MCQSAVRGTTADYGSNTSGFREYGTGTIPYEDDGIDLCYVKDGARAIQLVQMANTLQHQIYNIGGGKNTTNAELAQAVFKKIPSANIPLQPGKGPRWKQDAYMDISRIEDDLGFSREYSIEDGVADYIDWLQNNPQ
jgi:UDP-glucose 4-epimerase